MHTGIKYFTEVFLYVLPLNWARKKLKKINHPNLVLAHFGPSLAHCAPGVEFWGSRKIQNLRLVESRDKSIYNTLVDIGLKNEIGKILD